MIVDILCLPLGSQARAMDDDVAHARMYVGPDVAEVCPRAPTCIRVAIAAQVVPRSTLGLAPLVPPALLGRAVAYTAATENERPAGLGAGVYTLASPAGRRPGVARREDATGDEATCGI